MTRLFDEQGRNIPVTVVEAGPCIITQIKTIEKDGYEAIQLGYGEVNEKKANMPKMGHLKKAGHILSTLKEFRNLPLAGKNVGDEITVALFNKGDSVNITGKSIGKGFQGTVKRHKFSGGPKTHGQSDRLRAPGSIGASSFPSRVWKGMRMSGHMGNRTVTARNLKIVGIDPEKNLLLIKGAVPGSRNGIVRIVKVKG
jgi:large subunit ribosomal protein L3